MPFSSQRFRCRCATISSSAAAASRPPLRRRHVIFLNRNDAQPPSAAKIFAVLRSRCRLMTSPVFAAEPLLRFLAGHYFLHYACISRRQHFAIG